MKTKMKVKNLKETNLKRLKEVERLLRVLMKKNQEIPIPKEREKAGFNEITEAIIKIRQVYRSIKRMKIYQKERNLVKE